MRNYIIKDSTIAILKQEKKTIIYNVENFVVFNKSIKKILDENCMLHGSNLNGRIKSVQKILNVKYRVPILISEKENIILLPMNSMRDKECLYIVANKIIDYTENEDYLEIKCINNQIFKTKISKYSFEKMIINMMKLNNYLKWENFVN